MRTLITGSLFLVIGSMFLYLSGSHDMGTAGAMGPGYFPTIISSLLMVCGLTLIVKALL